MKAMTDAVFNQQWFVLGNRSPAAYHHCILSVVGQIVSDTQPVTVAGIVKCYHFNIVFYSKIYVI